MLTRLLYLIKESLRGWKYHRQVLVPTLFTVFLCMTLFLSGWVLINGIYSAQSASKNSWEIQVHLKEQYADSASIHKVHQRLDSVAGIQDLVLVPREEAVEEYRRMFGDEALDVAGVEALPIAFKMNVHESSRTLYFLKWLRDSFRLWVEVDDAFTSAEGLELLETWKGRLLQIVVPAGGLLLIILWFILRNAVRMGLYSRKVLLENMKYIGAEEWFITLPFLWENAILAAFGGILAWTLINLLLGEFASWELMALQVDSWYLPLWPAIVIPVAIATLACYSSVRRYLRESRQ